MPPHMWYGKVNAKIAHILMYGLYMRGAPLTLVYPYYRIYESRQDLCSAAYCTVRYGDTHTHMINTITHTHPLTSTISDRATNGIIKRRVVWLGAMWYICGYEGGTEMCVCVCVWCVSGVVHFEIICVCCVYVCALANDQACKRSSAAHFPNPFKPIWCVKRRRHRRAAHRR